MIGYRLFLDDERDPEDEFVVNQWPIEFQRGAWFVARTPHEFKELIDSNFRRGSFPTQVSFDHDLGIDDAGSEMSGTECARWLVEFCIEKGIGLPAIAIHSANPIGRKRIEAEINDFAKFHRLAKK